MKYISTYLSPCGTILLSAEGKFLTGLWFEEQKLSYEYDLYCSKNLPIFEQTKKWLDMYFAGENPNFYPKIKLSGTKFQTEVWNLLREIEYGSVITYNEIAKQIAKRRKIEKMSAQAIGQAVGKNKILIIIPCHRVIGSDGKLTGYAGGIDKKIKLLELEKGLKI